MNIVEDLIKNYLRHVDIDYLGLWVICARLRENLGIKSDTDVKEKALQVVSGLIKDGVYPGFMRKGGGFDFWTGTPAELMTRVAASWPTTGIPDLGTNHCWFARRADFDAAGNILRRRSYH